MRIVLDSDEERFGGHCRLEEGHGKPLPAGPPTHNRPAAAISSVGLVLCLLC